MSGIKDAKKKRARRRRKRQIQRILLIIAMVLILIGFIFLVRAAIRTVVNKFTVPAVTTSANKTAGTKSTAGKHKTKKKSASKKKTSTKNTSPKADSSKRAVQLETVTISKKNKKNPDKVSLTISSTGDCTLGTDENFSYSTSLNAYYESYGADYFFQNVRSIFQKDDLSIVNMEGTLTDETAREAKTFAFKAPAKYAAILSGSSIEAANLANNHSHDYGKKSYTDTDENFSYSTSLNAYYESYGADYFFQNVRSIFQKDDLSIVNMEGTLTDETAREAKTFAFKAPAKYAAILSGSSIEAANLANNHSHDYGKKSYTDTISALDDAGIASFGYNRVKIFKVKGIKVGVTGIYELADHQKRASQVKKNIKALKKAGAQIIIVNFHWGIEKQYTPDENQKALAHLAIDEGADLVIGHHPHVLEGIEKYNGKYICYSLGNFCFGGNSTPGDTDSMIVQQTFTFHKGKLKKSSKLNIIPCSITSSSGYNDYCPVPLTGDEKQRVLDKISQYSEEL